MPESRYFPSTVWDVIDRAGRAAAGSEDLDAVARRYWRPVYRFVRIVWKKTPEDAQDLTQEFLAKLLDPEFLQAANPDRGNFRAFLVSSLRNFLVDQQREARAARRGGGRRVFSFEIGDGEEALQIPDQADPEAVFQREWATEILRRALETLEARYDAEDRVRLDVFRRYYLEENADDVGYREIAGQLGIDEQAIRNHLRAVRQDVREECVRIVRETVTDPNQVEAELAYLFGRA